MASWHLRILLVCDIHDDSLADCWKSTVQSLLNVLLTPVRKTTSWGLDYIRVWGADVLMARIIASPTKATFANR